MYVVDNPSTGIPSGQRVVRFRDVDDIGQDYTVIVDNLPAVTITFHNGWAHCFRSRWDALCLHRRHWRKGACSGPQETRGIHSALQSRWKHTSSDNPIPGSPVYAIGLRNVFGFAFQPNTGFLYATDNGPGGFDEVNRVEAGHNYGWPRPYWCVRHVRGGFPTPLQSLAAIRKSQSGPPVLPLPTANPRPLALLRPITTSTCVLYL